MPKTREPAWWMLYALVPVMGGLLVLEFRASLSSGWHKAVQVGIILFVYSLVWVWLWANDSAMLRDRLNRNSPSKDERNAIYVAQSSAFRSLGAPLTPDRGNAGSVRLSSTFRCVNRRTHRRRMRKCSHSLGQQLFRWRS
jgi:hypothetical protein